MPPADAYFAQVPPNFVSGGSVTKMQIHNRWPGNGLVQKRHQKMAQTKCPSSYRVHFHITFLERTTVVFFINTWMELVPKTSYINKPALVQLMAERQTGDRPLSAQLLVYLNAFWVVCKWIVCPEVLRLIHSSEMSYRIVLTSPVPTNA